MATWLKFAEQETTQITALLLALSLPFSPFHDSPLLLLSSFHFISLQFEITLSFGTKRNSARDRVEESVSHRVSAIFFFFFKEL